MVLSGLPEIRDFGRATCFKCATDCTTRHFICDAADGEFCPDCFALTPCGLGEHGESCRTHVIHCASEGHHR